MERADALGKTADMLEESLKNRPSGHLFSAEQSLFYRAGRTDMQLQLMIESFSDPKQKGRLLKPLETAALLTAVRHTLSGRDL